MFADEIRERITPEAYTVLGRTGIGNYEEMYALLVQFPSIANSSGVSLPSLSNVAAAGVSAAAMATIQAHAQSQLRFALGAVSPPNSIVGTGYQQPVASSIPSPTMAPNTPIHHTLNAPVRDQGQRGTCVAHAVVACVEWKFSFQPLSEQFKYWAIKTHGGDPFPNQAGTTLRCAKNSLASHGVCEGVLWPYNPQPIAGNETQAGPGSPSAAALQDASLKAQSNTLHSNTSSQNSGKAALLASELTNGPVAVSLPVFVDVITDVANWAWTGAYEYGHVIDPTPFSVVKGGHAVCVCGYSPSTSAPGGGWFVFKNSWGVSGWSAGVKAPPSGQPALNPGYGYMSAAYVDEFLWELLRV
jgi:hypothetical protein